MIALYMCIIMVFCMENENSTQLYHQKYCDSRHIEATNVISVEIDPGYILHYIEQPQYQSKILFERSTVGAHPSEIPACVAVWQSEPRLVLYLKNYWELYVHT